MGHWEGGLHLQGLMLQGLTYSMMNIVIYFEECNKDWT